MNITFKVDFNTLRIYYNEVLHFIINRSLLVSIQSYRIRNSAYTIEYNLNTGKSILTEYEDRQDWILILQKLDEIGI